MDFLDSLDLETNDKSQRVRSWYLYEQFKEIEKNQLDAAKKLKDRSYQDRILRQELAERKVRRSLYDHTGTCSDSKLHIDKYGDDSVLSPTEDMFESVADLHEESLYDFGDFQDDLSRADLVVGHCFKEDLKSVEEFKDCNSCADSIRCFRNVESNDNIRNEAKQMFASVNFDNLQSPVDDSNYNFNEIEKSAKVKDDDKPSEISSLVSVNDYEEIEQPKRPNNEIAAFAFWTKLVSFAYQITKLNHGNCFYDYSSQLMTAVLICDVLRRGICKMCNILQPYVSPIKFADDIDEPHSNKIKKNKNRAKLENLKKSMIFLERTLDSSVHNLRFKGKCESEKYASKRHRTYFENCNKNTKSEPWRRISKFSISKTCLKRDSISPECSRITNTSSCEVCECVLCHKRVSNPMLKVVRCIDDYLEKDTQRKI